VFALTGNANDWAPMGADKSVMGEADESPVGLATSLTSFLGGANGLRASLLPTIHVAVRVPKEFHWPSSLNTKASSSALASRARVLWGRCLGLLSARGLRLLRQSCSHVSEPHIGVLRHGL
jgi:hypothetical protein